MGLASLFLLGLVAIGRALGLSNPRSPVVTDPVSLAVKDLNGTEASTYRSVRTSRSSGIFYGIRTTRIDRRANGGKVRNSSEFSGFEPAVPFALLRLWLISYL
jgi:hypothetical protein